MRELIPAVFLILMAGPAFPGLGQTLECEALRGPKRELARRLLETEHLYTCCDDTIATCLRARPACALAIRLATNICRRVASGQDENRIRRSFSRRARSMVGGSAPAVVDLEHAALLGPSDAPVTIAVYACARCPYCSKLVPALHTEVTGGRLKGVARLVFRPFPIRGHPGSTEGGLAFVAALRMGRFWEFALHSYQLFDDFSPERLVSWARDAGLDREAFRARMADELTREMLIESKKEGVRNGVEETPALFLNGKRWVGDLEIAELVDAVEEEAARTRGDLWQEP